MRPSEAKRGRVPPGCSPAVFGIAESLRDAGGAAASVSWNRDTPGVPGVAEAGDTFGAAVASEDWNTGGVPDVTVGSRGQSGPEVKDGSHREVIGPLLDGHGASGVIVRRGTVIASWGDPTRVEMAYSAAKSVLSPMAGIAHDDGLLIDGARVPVVAPTGAEDRGSTRSTSPASDTSACAAADGGGPGSSPAPGSMTCGHRAR
ncbi:hypothetical protein [Streptomyces hygroscopicus]|uniref:hypothetical protein n=1 Tax=Streptomyces hygroscopicus TaxID=1912 RepID=UPI00202EB3A6|nr:hypothetical protein [Streptomyces hygroscopicus]